MRIRLFIFSLLLCAQLSIAIESDNKFLEPENVIYPLGPSGLNWRYTVVEPPAGWMSKTFDASQWTAGAGGFYIYPGENDRDIPSTFWSTSDIWLQAKFTVTHTQIDDLMFWSRWDDSIEVYVNGVLATKAPVHMPHYYRYLGLSNEARSSLVAGENTISVKVNNLGGEGYFDLAIVENSKLARLPFSGVVASSDLEFIRSFVIEQMQKYGIPAGSFSLSRSNRSTPGDYQQLVSLGVGYLDREFERYVKKDSVFRLASLDKGPSIESLKRMFIGKPIYNPIDTNTGYFTCDISQDTQKPTAVTNPATGQLLTCNDKIVPILDYYGVIDSSNVVDSRVLDIRIIDVAYLQSGVRNPPNAHNETEVAGYLDFLEIEESETSPATLMQWYLYDYTTRAPGARAEYNSNDTAIVRVLVDQLHGGIENYLQNELVSGSAYKDFYIANEQLAGRVRDANGELREPWVLAYMEPALDTWLEDGLALSASAETYSAYKALYGGGSTGGGMPGTVTSTREWGGYDGIHQYQMTWLVSGELIPLADLSGELYEAIIDLDQNSPSSLDIDTPKKIIPVPEGAFRHASSGYCIHPNGGSPNPVNGSSAVLWPDCIVDQDRVLFSYTTKGSIKQRSSGKCLHPQGGFSNPTDGTPLVFWDGCDEDRLRFYQLSTGQIQHVESGKCLHIDKTNGGFATGTPVTFKGCQLIEEQIFTASLDASEVPCKLVPSNQVPNCSFDVPTATNWSVAGYNGGSVYPTYNGGVLQLHISSPGNLDWHVQAVTPVELTSAGTYTLSFRAKGEAARSININLGHNGSYDNNWQSYYNKTIEISESMELYTLVLPNIPSDTLARLDFNAGNHGTADIYLDEVRLTRD